MHTDFYTPAIGDRPVKMLFDSNAGDDPGMGLIACSLIIAGAILIAPGLAGFLAEGSGSLFWPGKKFDRPLPMYSIPQSKSKKGLYEEAMTGFEKIAENYPDEVQPYIEMIDIAICNLKDPARANLIYQQGMSILKKEDSRQSLAQMYGAIRTRLNARPGN